MTELSTRFALPLLQAGQAQKELFHNEALVAIDALMHPAVATLSTGMPPTAPLDGESWIVGAGATGAWDDRDGRIATWTGGGWRFAIPQPGLRVWLKDRARWAWHDGTAWRDVALPCAGLSVDGQQVIGARRPAIADPAGGSVTDVEARAALSAALSALRQHGLIAT